MPLPSLRDWAVLGGNFLLWEQLDWDREKLRTDVIANHASFNDEQTQLFDAVKIVLTQMRRHHMM